MAFRETILHKFNAISSNISQYNKTVPFVLKLHEYFRIKFMLFIVNTVIKTLLVICCFVI